MSRPPDAPRSNWLARRTGAFAALGAVPVLIVGAVFLLGVGGDPDTLSTDNEAIDTTATTTAPPTTAAATTTTSAVAPTTTPPPTSTVPETLPEQASQPIAPPSDPRGAEEQIHLGNMSIPKLGVSEPLLSGIRLTTLDQGLGHWPGTAMPGEVGNVVVAGHRTSHGASFRDIDQLVAGDIVQFEIGTDTIDYKVTGTQIVEPDALWIVDPTDTPTATLFACHPPGSTRQRIVVNLALA
jgi:sortase A